MDVNRGEWLTMDQIRDKYKMDGPFLENALKYMKKKTLTTDDYVTTITMYQVPWREKITVVSTPVTDDNTEQQ